MKKQAFRYVSDGFGFKIMIKTPSSAIRSIIKGCKVEFLYGKDLEAEKPIFHIGVRIYDDSIHFINICSPHRYEREYNSLLRVIKNEIIPVQFYNEMSICVATCEILFDPVSRIRVLNLLGKKCDNYIGPFSEKMDHSLDCFVYSFNKSQKFENLHEIETLFINGTFQKWQMMQNHFASFTDKSPIIINDSNEGKVLEKQVWAVLESLFGKDIYLSPQVNHKKGTRELTDIFAFSEYGLFLVETKALGILNNDKEKTMDRKVAGIQKQVDKAIEQLSGAMRKIRGGEPVLDSKGIAIDFDRKLLPHRIVLVSELLPFGDWTEIIMKMYQTMIVEKMQLHLMDFTEFMRYMGYSKKSKDMFDYLLMQRPEGLVKHNTVHINLQGPSDSKFSQKETDTNSYE